MLIHNNNLIYSPTDLVRFFESEFSSYMDHFEKVACTETKKKYEVCRDPLDPLFSLICDMGNQHEATLITKMEKSNPITHINKNTDSREQPIKQTLKALQQGKQYIYQAAIQKENLFGYADLLVKTKGESDLGDYHYIPYDFKISKTPNPSAIIQLCCYCDILESLQGVLPKTFIIITKEETHHELKTEQFLYFYKFLKNKFIKYHEGFSECNIPVPHKKAKHRDWSQFTQKRLNKSNDISLIKNISSTYIGILKRANITTIAELRTQKKLTLKGISQINLQNLQEQAFLQSASINTQTPEFKLLPLKGKQQGLKILPPQNKADIYLNIKGYPLLGKTGLEYLYGYIINKNSQHICIWATHKKQEAIALNQWINRVYQYWLENPNMHIYHYKNYEVATLKQLITNYNIGEQKLNELLKHHVFIDLHRVIIQTLKVGTLSDSLKDIQPLYCNNTNIVSKHQAMLQFSHFLNSQDNPDTSLFLEKIKTYNKDICLSIKKLYQFLNQLQKKHSISYIPQKTIEPPYADSDFIKQCEQKATELLQDVPLFERALPLSKMQNNTPFYMKALLAHLLKFYTLEAQPIWWNYLSYLNMEEAELIKDRHTIASCRWEKSKDQVSKIIFDKEQEINFNTGSTVIILEHTQDIKNTYTISYLDLNIGCLYLTPKNQNQVPVNKTFTLVAEQNIFYKKNLFLSILKTANDFSLSIKYMGLKKCIYDLLLKKESTLPHSTNTTYLNKTDILQNTTHRILNLQNSVFCIQGPPGSGKTYTIAHIILQLIKAKKTIGVMANSHKAISQVLKKIFQHNTDNHSFLCQKVTNATNKDEDTIFFNGLPIQLVTSHQVSPLAQVVGGTAFFFSKSSQENTYDYLIVDEASQVSLANIVAAARSTKNIILIGDQNQLDPPTRSTHPGESELSALAYYTDNNITITNNKGIFLPVSYRMHPSICQFISHQFYDKKLSAHPSTAIQKIILTPALKTKHSLIPESGLCFIPVTHFCNTHSSVEEAKIITSIYKELLQTKWINNDNQQKPITTQDILIISPYNFQVACLKKQLNIPEARIASIDKFQGQEAPITILSLATSTIEDAPRRISFLLNKNRLNVALSRARCVSIIVGSTNLADIHVSSINNLELMNIWCRLTCKNQ